MIYFVYYNNLFTIIICLLYPDIALTHILYLSYLMIYSRIFRKSWHGAEILYTSTLQYDLTLSTPHPSTLALS